MLGAPPTLRGGPRACPLTSARWRVSRSGGSSHAGVSACPRVGVSACRRECAGVRGSARKCAGGCGYGQAGPGPAAASACEQGRGTAAAWPGRRVDRVRRGASGPPLSNLALLLTAARRMRLFLAALGRRTLLYAAATERSVRSPPAAVVVFTLAGRVVGVVSVSGLDPARVHRDRRCGSWRCRAGARDPVRRRAMARGSSRPLGAGGVIVARAARAHRAGRDAWRPAAWRPAPRGLVVGV